jgi:hypothetical protein
MSAEQMEFERATGDGSYEWSVPSAPDQGRNYRLFVAIESDVSRLITVEECPVTSVSPGAQRMEVEGEPRRSVVLTMDEARWLLDTLPKAMARIERAWAEAPTEPAPAKREKAGTP